MKYDRSDSIMELLNNGAMICLEGEYFHRHGPLIYSSTSIYSPGMFLHEYRYSTIEKVIPKEMIRWGALSYLHRLQKCEIDWYNLSNGLYPKDYVYNTRDIMDMIESAKGLVYVLTGPTVKHGLLSIFQSNWCEVSLNMVKRGVVLSTTPKHFILDIVNLSDNMYDNPELTTQLYKQNMLLESLEVAKLALIITEHSVRITKNRSRDNGNIIVYFNSIM